MRRRFLIPEVVQTSMMDCGPASLKAMLEGWRIPISYGRLREACQTDVDGTSIDTMEAVGAQLGLNAEQIMLPVDHVLLAAAHALPAIVVVLHPGGFTHFVIAWRQHGSLIQLMDPATGRRWISRERFLDELYVHTMPVPAAAWREWAGSSQFLDQLRERFVAICIPHETANRLLTASLADESWRSLGALDAATRLVSAISVAGGLKPGSQAARALELFFHNALSNEIEGATIPPAYWSVRPTSTKCNQSEEQILLRGAVLVRVSGAEAVGTKDASRSEKDPQAQPLSQELQAALKERPIKPMRELFRRFMSDGVLAPSMLVGAIGFAAGAVLIEVFLFRVLLDIGHELVLLTQRLTAISMLLVFLTLLFLIDVPIIATVLRLGRRLELRLRIAFLLKIPRLNDRYFQSRLTSDMAERGHSIHRIRSWPDLGSQFLRACFALTFTIAAVIWLSPSQTLVAVLAAAVAVGIPLVSNPFLAERDLRVRTHAGALSRYYLDAFRGIIPIRAHRAEKKLRREHEGLLLEWARASRSLNGCAVLVEAVHLFATFGLAVALAYNYLIAKGSTGNTLLFIYWVLSLPELGQEIGGLARLYPAHRNITSRLLEPLGAIEDAEETRSDLLQSFASPRGSKNRTGVKLELRHVSVRAGGHVILDEIDLVIESGKHVAIVGPSGAGKSSLVGLFLGWHKPASGFVMVDGLPLDGIELEKLRLATAWVDPTVQLWNRSLIDNLRYGSPADSLGSLSNVVADADLAQVLERLSDGMQTRLGEGGALLSGGEGQRVRLGRAMVRPNARLVILDEPFRGLDRESRHKLLANARRYWHGATLLCVTHDIKETLMFERVLTLERGRVIEDGPPQELIKHPSSSYCGLLRAEEEVRKGLWSDIAWRRFRMENGHLNEMSPKT